MWACTRPLHSAHAEAELVGRGRVVILVSCVMSIAAVGRVILLIDYCIMVLHVNPNPTRYPVIPNRSDFNLCLQPRALIILKL